MKCYQGHEEPDLSPKEAEKKRIAYRLELSDARSRVEKIDDKVSELVKQIGLSFHPLLFRRTNTDLSVMNLFFTLLKLMMKATFITVAAL